MFVIDYTGKFKRDLKLLKKRSPKQFRELQQFVEQLEKTGFEGVEMKYHPHYLSGNYHECCECHVLNDLLLIWFEDKDNMIITLIRTGTHSDLF